jgi:hypothetical protein
MCSEFGQTRLLMKLGINYTDISNARVISPSLIVLAPTFAAFGQFIFSRALETFRLAQTT